MLGPEESGNALLTPVDGKFVEMQGGLRVDGPCDVDGKLMLDGLEKDVATEVADVKVDVQAKYVRMPSPPLPYTMHKRPPSER